MLVTRQGLVTRRGWGIFLFTTTSRPALGPTQPRFQWVKLTTHLNLVPMLRMRRAISPPPYVLMEWCLIKLRVALIAWYLVKHRDFTQPPVQWVPGALSLGTKWPGLEADHSSPSSAEVKECVELYLHYPYLLMEWCLI
jgi:hypothetical protein